MLVPLAGTGHPTLGVGAYPDAILVSARLPETSWHEHRHMPFGPRLPIAAEPGPERAPVGARRAPVGAQAASSAGAPARALPSRPAAQATPDRAEVDRETRLAQLVQEEEALWTKASAANAEEDPVLQQAFLDLVHRYEAFISAEPHLVEAQILFGKLLRKLGQADRAQEAFLAADRLDPNLAVVKQQLGNYLAERGDALGSVRMFLRAIALDPEVALYHYQLGELLSHFRQDLLASGELTVAVLDRQMLEAFGTAVRLDPDQMTFRLRWGEAHDEAATPDWASALTVFEDASPRARTDLERQAILLHRARCLKELGRREEALSLARAVTDPRLASSKARVLEGL